MSTTNTATITRESQQRNSRSNKPILLILGSIAVGMFAFAVFILPPLYDIFCEVTGLNGKSDSLARQTVADFTKNSAIAADAAPLITNNIAENQTALITDSAAADGVAPKTLQFLADTHPDMPWNFKPAVFSMKISPGKRHQTTFIVKNLTGEAMAGQAVPSVSPGHMAQYLKKIECFCFTNQTLEPYEEKEMPLSFYLAEDAPEDISTLTLSYMLYNITNKETGNETASTAQSEGKQQPSEDS